MINSYQHKMRNIPYNRQLRVRVSCTNLLHKEMAVLTKKEVTVLIKKEVMKKKEATVFIKKEIDQMNKDVDMMHRLLKLIIFERSV